MCLCQYSYDDFPLTVHINCDWQCICVYLPMRWGYETVLRVETYFDFQYQHLLFYSFIPDLVLVSLSTAIALMLFIIARSGVVFSERELTFTFAICCRLSPVRLSVCRLSSVVGNTRAPYSGGSNFRQYFYGIWYPSHPLTSTENFTEIVPGEPLRRGS